MMRDAMNLFYSCLFFFFFFILHSSFIIYSFILSLFLCLSLFFFLQNKTFNYFSHVDLYDSLLLGTLLCRNGTVSFALCGLFGSDSDILIG